MAIKKIKKIGEKMKETKFKYKDNDMVLTITWQAGTIYDTVITEIVNCDGVKAIAEALGSDCSEVRTTKNFDSMDKAALDLYEELVKEARDMDGVTEVVE